MLDPEEIIMNPPWWPGHRHSWPQSHHEDGAGERSLSSPPAFFYGKKKYKGSTQDVPRNMGQNKQWIVDAWKQHSLNMFSPQIRDPWDVWECNKCEGQEFELAQGSPFSSLTSAMQVQLKASNWGQLETCKIRV